MPVRPCIFCPRAGIHFEIAREVYPQTSEIDPRKVKRLALPVYLTRVSPVLDTCTRLVLIDLNGGREILRNEIPATGISLGERLRLLLNLKVELVICAGTSQQFYSGLNQKGVQLITGIVGEIEQVVQGFLNGRLKDPVFRMPGFTPLHALTEISHHEP